MPTISKVGAIERDYPINHFFYQTILFDKSLTKKECISWLKSHNFNYNNYRIMGQHRRFLQTNPVKDAIYFSKKLNNLITIVWQKYSP